MKPPVALTRVFPIALGGAIVLFAALDFADAARAGTPAAPAEWTNALSMKVRQIGSVQIAPDGKHVAYTVRQAVMDDDKSEYLTHIHVSSADGRQINQLTRGDKSCDDPRWSPDGKWIAFVSSRTGKKNLWVVEADGGDPTQLTDVATAVLSFNWSPDGQMLAFTAKTPQTSDELTANRQKNDARVVDENAKMVRLHVIPFTSPPRLQREARALTGEQFSVGNLPFRAGRAAHDWSPDNKTIVFSHVRSTQADDWPSADLSTVDVASGDVRPFAHSLAAETAPQYSPDGKWVAFVASDNPPTWAGTGRVHIVPAGGGTPKALAETPDGFGRYSELLGWSADGQKLYVSEVQGVHTRLLALPLDGAPSTLSERDGMSLSGLFLDSTRTKVGFGWETASQPAETFVSSVQRLEPVQVSYAQHELPKATLGSTEVVRWKSTESHDIEGLLTYPVGYEKGKRYPLLLLVHGGPMGVFTQTFIGSPGTYPVATFAAQGYAVLRPNPRGSSGYGAKFRYANYGDWGKGDYRDVMAGVDHVIGMGVADPERLGVMGWSYGGFMTSWTITQTKRFRAASVGAGVTNLMSFSGTADIPSFLPDYFGGEFWDKFDVYRAHSAMFHVKGVTTPTLIQHGERDERVPLSQGMELYNALKRQGCTTKMVIYPRTPHGIEEPRLMLDCMNRNVEWFDRHVRGAKESK